jgi:hypothetical protein
MVASLTYVVASSLIHLRMAEGERVERSREIPRWCSKPVPTVRLPSVILLSAVPAGVHGDDKCPERNPAYATSD